MKLQGRPMAEDYLRPAAATPRRLEPGHQPLCLSAGRASIPELERALARDVAQPGEGIDDEAVSGGTGERG